MTYREAYDAIALELVKAEAHDKSFCLEAVAWQHCGAGEQPRLSFSWRLWVTAFSWSASAETLADVFQQLLDSLPRLVRRPAAEERSQRQLADADFELPSHITTKEMR